MDAIETASSGHPGMPLGMAEFGAYMYGELLQYNPRNPYWYNRDRFVLSAGHGSMWLYALLHLSGYNLTIEDIKQFRHIHSKTPGHPEYRHTEGVETTTGPLGQGIANAVGFAIAESMLSARFSIIHHYTYVLAGDGCLMEGVSAEASSLAGHLCLGHLILFYDSNNISIDGSTDITFTEDSRARYQAYGWQVLEADPYDLTSLRAAIKAAKENKSQPSFIILHSVIAKGSAEKEGLASTHGAPLGEKEVRATKLRLQMPTDTLFFVPQIVKEFFTHHAQMGEVAEHDWQEKVDQWGIENPGLLAEWKERQNNEIGDTLRYLGIPKFQEKESISTRKASNTMLQALSSLVPHLVGGSADLAASNLTNITEHTDFSAKNRRGKTIRFGVREHGMAAITNGIVIYGGFKAFCATFLVFSDYMRPSIRLAALMRIPTIFLFSHDSIYVGEDGPTHQPIEHLASLRAIPGLQVLRPADAEETTQAWLMALESRGPTCIVVSRQGLPVYKKWDSQWCEHMRDGGYIVHEPTAVPQLVILSTGSEVSLALNAIKGSRVPIRVVAVSDVNALRQSLRRKELIPENAPVLVVEAAVAQGWEDFTPREHIISIERFGLSGKGEEVATYLGISVHQIIQKIDMLCG
ncbi:hypothetical protein LSH36_583g02022 [Paralvinella palmiformis]|uniref:transketolase n=1 Tax=Paralvinella palmiformis TaxID=53620 RepID=A0AAD9J6Z2_9ANNE|nr:hypothetical protein LSH36_583g02022 [Paralvinella palmiformis]